VSRSRPCIAYLFTTFPKSTETFLQREVAAVQAQGFDLRLYSLIGGGGEFAGIEVRRFSMWRLVELIWVIPWVAATRWDVFGILWRGLFSRRAPSWLNFWENMLGAGFAGVFYPEFRRIKPDLLHAAWGGAPATAAWILSRLGNFRYSAAAHAYDIYEHGGDWWLDEKLSDARFIHTSTEMGKTSLADRGHDLQKIQVIRRGIPQFPTCRELRKARSPLNIVCVARLVEKKGLFHQLKIYERLKTNGIDFEARIIGNGPLMADLRVEIEKYGLANSVQLTGHLAQAEVWAQFDWADVLVHTGVVAESGDRDGLPNVIPEAMMAGVLVITSPAAATTEAIHHEKTGWVFPVDQPQQWAAQLSRISHSDEKLDRVRTAARQWTEMNYDGVKNAERLSQLFRSVIES